MLSNAKNYFSFFGILASSVNAKIEACYSTMKNLFHILPKIETITAQQLKQPVLVQNKTQNNN